jgi:hypothetical protein
VVGVVFLQVRGFPSPASSSTVLPGCGGASLSPTFSPASAGGWCRVYRRRPWIVKVALGVDGFALEALCDGG